MQAQIHPDLLRRLGLYKELMESNGRFATLAEAVKWYRFGIRPNRGYVRRHWNERLIAKSNRAMAHGRRLSRRDKLEILLSGPCVYCGGHPTVVDHVIPLARGGGPHRRNLAPACQPCNQEKFDKLLDEWRAQRLEGGRSWPPRWPDVS